MIYGNEGTQSLLTGLATQVIYGGCDADTADFYSNASGTATQTDSDNDKHSRSRPLLTIDEVITPQIGNCTIFARYVEEGFATQVILNARLTRFYERDDWKRWLKSSEGVEPLLLERGITLNVSLPIEPRDKLREAAESAMDKVTGDTQFTSLGVMRQNHLKQKEAMAVES